MSESDIPPEYAGGWRIVDIGTWINDYLDTLTPAMALARGVRRPA